MPVMMMMMMMMMMMNGVATQRPIIEDASARPPHPEVVVTSERVAQIFGWIWIKTFSRVLREIFLHMRGPRCAFFVSVRMWLLRKMVAHIFG